jgi:hypothetical protein
MLLLSARWKCGGYPDQTHLRIRVDRAGQRRAAPMDACQTGPAAVIWPRLRLQG